MIPKKANRGLISREDMEKALVRIGRNVIQHGIWISMPISLYERESGQKETDFLMEVQNLELMQAILDTVIMVTHPAKHAHPSIRIKQLIREDHLFFLIDCEDTGLNEKFSGLLSKQAEDAGIYFQSISVDNLMRLQLATPLCG